MLRDEPRALARFRRTQPQQPVSDDRVVRESGLSTGQEAEALVVARRRHPKKVADRVLLLPAVGPTKSTNF